jgi:hypothetical protein
MEKVDARVLSASNRQARHFLPGVNATLNILGSALPLTFRCDMKILR